MDGFTSEMELVSHLAESYSLYKFIATHIVAFKTLLYGSVVLLNLNVLSELSSSSSSSTT